MIASVRVIIGQAGRQPSRVAWVTAGLAIGLLVAIEATRVTAPAVEPVAPSTFLDADRLRAALDYRGPLRWVSVLSSLLRVATAILVAWWAVRRRRRGPVESAAPGRWRLLRVAAAGAGLWVLTDLVRVPVQLWAWRRSVEVGLSTQDLSGWARDWAVESVPYWIGVGLAVAGAAWVRERRPATWVPITGIVGGLVGALLVVLSPLVFEPLVFDLTRLEDPSLRQGIERLVERAGGGDDAEILVADASRRTTASNAYVSGIGTTRRIVLYDTLIDDAPAPEVLTIVAHELGHDLHHDVERAALSLLAVAVLAVWAIDALVGERLTDRAGRVTPAGAVQAVAVIIVLAVLLAPVERWSSRRSEAAADAAALALTDDPATYRDMMIGLASRNLSDPAPPPWTVGLFYSHPPIASRIARAERG